MFSFESEKDGLAFINEVKRPGIRTAALNAWPDKVWRTEIHVDFNPSEAAIKALELELQNLLLKHKGTYLGMVLQMRD